jgi:DNA mismatch repair ATPase MutS
VTRSAISADATALRDLDVFTSATRYGPTLAALVDRTRTVAGRRAIEARLGTPSRHRSAPPPTPGVAPGTRVCFVTGPNMAG